VSTIAASIGLLAMLAVLAWCASLLPHRPVCGWTWCYSVLTTAKIAGAIVVLFATFTLGLWLTSEPFPTGRKFVAVELNGKPIISAERGTKLPTLGVWRSPFASDFNAGGTGHCNYWNGKIRSIPPNFLVWGGIFRTAMGCAAGQLEDRYFQALLGTNRWRIENGALILYNGTDTLRFQLAPPPCRWPWCARRFRLADG
jgi:heat shock protein HslJ